MWPFLLVLAIVPLIFIWSDSVREIFPALSEWLPESSKAAVAPHHNGQTPPVQAINGVMANQWIISNTPQGYVAWTLSSDQKYRLAVGCYPGAAASVQVTHVNGQILNKVMVLNYQYGHLPLDNGLYVGPDLIGSVAQFTDIHLQTPAGAVLAQFNVPGYVSGALAREVQSTCARDSYMQ